jgi:hypothetical protein
MGQEVPFSICLSTTITVAQSLSGLTAHHDSSLIFQVTAVKISMFSGSIQAGMLIPIALSQRKSLAVNKS